MVCGSERSGGLEKRAGEAGAACRSWAERFEAEAALPQKTIGDWITGGIHHVGSTAVPGLDAKPIIDIAVGVESLEAAQPCIGLLGEIDYRYSPF